MSLTSLEKLLEQELKDLYNAENQLVMALPRMAKAASADGLKQAIARHLEETRGHVERLDQIGEVLGIKLTGKKCKAMEGLIEEGKEVLEEDGDPAILDLAIIGAAQRVEHYEISAYGTAKTLAQRLGHAEVVKLLEQTEQEESAADEKLTGIAVDEVMPTSPAGEEEAGDGEERPARNGRAGRNGATKTRRRKGTSRR